MSHAKVMLNLSITDHKSFYSNIFTQFMLHKINQSKHMAKHPRTEKQTEQAHLSPSFSLRQEGLAQAREFSRSSELLSPKR